MNLQGRRETLRVSLARHAKRKTLRVLKVTIKLLKLPTPHSIKGSWNIVGDLIKEQDPKDFKPLRVLLVRAGDFECVTF
jgi:hypothetical protein